MSPTRAKNLLLVYPPNPPTPPVTRFKAALREDFLLPMANCKSSEASAIIREPLDFSLLTPALSPLRGEGVAPHARRPFSASRRAHTVLGAGDLTSAERGVHAASPREHPTAPTAATDFHSAERALRAPSPLNGERAGVRGEAARKAHLSPRFASGCLGQPNWQLAIANWQSS